MHPHKPECPDCTILPRRGPRLSSVLDGPPALAQSETNPPFLEAIPRPVGHPPATGNGGFVVSRAHQPQAGLSSGSGQGIVLELDLALRGIRYGQHDLDLRADR